MAAAAADRLQALTEAVISQHSSLRGIAQQLAEVYYIVGAQQLDGYGQASFESTQQTLQFPLKNPKI